MSRDRGTALIAADQGGLSIVRKCELLGISRSALYYDPKGESELNLKLMKLIDAQFLETPWYGSRQMARWLRRQGHGVGRPRTRRLMRLIGLTLIYQVPRTSEPHPEHRIYPYLLRKVEITEPNHVWCADITYIPMQRGILYLVAIMDWATRAVLARRLSNTMDPEFCVEALQESPENYGTPRIFNTDQGSQFTSDEFTEVLNETGVNISMDGHGRWMDNVFIERLWRSLKYECIYLRAPARGHEALREIGTGITYYNHDRPHSQLGNDRTQMEVYTQKQAA